LDKRYPDRLKTWHYRLNDHAEVHRFIGCKWLLIWHRFAGTGGAFLLGFITGYAIKKVIKLAAVIVGLFIAALAYLEYQRIISVDSRRFKHFDKVNYTLSLAKF
jgi:hypothetical protein